jgi:hypothetical protein
MPEVHEATGFFVLMPGHAPQYVVQRAANRVS